MVVRTGIDIVHIPKIKRLMENDTAIRKIFHSNELKNLDAEHLAGIFAAKEAVFKALKKKPEWLSVELKYEDSGAPILNLSNDLAQKILHSDVSISHDEDYAIASVVFELNG